MHYGHTETVRATHADVLNTAYTHHPELFVREHPEPPGLPTAAWINKPTEQEQLTE